MSFFSELKRRELSKAGIAGAAVAWLLVQVQGSLTSARIRTAYKTNVNVR